MAEASPGKEDEITNTGRLDFDASDKMGMIEATIAIWPKLKYPSKPISFGPKSWRPDLILHNEWVCHLHAVSHIKSTWIERMQLARNHGYKIVVASPVECLYDEVLLNEMIKLDAHVTALKKKKDGNWAAEDFDSACYFIAKHKIQISSDILESAGNYVLSAAISSNSANAKGKKFEEFLCLLFGQIPIFEVFSHNYVTTTEEIDIVLRSRGASLTPISPIVLVSAKNTKSPVGVPALSSLYTKMGNRRGMCKLGFLCSAGKFASTVLHQDLRYSQGDKVVVPLDHEKLRKLVSSDTDRGQMIHDLITHAALT